MKQQFRNQHAAGIAKPLTKVQNAFFAVSSITSGVCIAAILTAYIAPDTTITSSPILWIPAILLGLAIASTIDFLIIKRTGKFAITELIAWLSGAFHTPIQRAINIIIFVSIVAFGAILSFISSWDGSAVAANMAPTFTPVMLAETVKTERLTVEKSVKPFSDAVKSIEVKIGETVNARTNGKLKELAKGGNFWAKGEILNIQKAVEKEYSKELAAAKTALQKAIDRENNRSDKVITHTEAIAVDANEKNQKRSTIIWKLLAAMGVLPLIFGVALMVAECNNTVLLAIPKEQKIQQKNGSGVGQRSSDEEFESLYTNP